MDLRTVYPLLDRLGLKDPLRTVRDDYVRPVQRRSRYRRGLGRIPEMTLDDRDVVLVVVDCLRGDHTTSSGYERDTTPFLSDVDARFPSVQSAAPWTFPSVSSIMTGQYPHNNGAVYDSAYRNLTGDDVDLPNTPREDAWTLSEILGRNGYSLFFSTAIRTAEIPLRSRFPKIEVEHMRPAEDVIDSLLSWWRRRDSKRKFGYVHLGDVHGPCDLPDSTPFGEIEALPNIGSWDFMDRTEPRDEFERYRRERVKLYDTLIRHVDEQIRRVYEATCADEDTVMLVLGDHGEAFWEHAALERDLFENPRGMYGVGHGDTVFQERVEVPLWLLGTDVETRIHDDRVSTVDVAPTILAELDAPSTLIDGLDGVPLQRGVPDRSLLSEGTNHGYEHKCVVHGRYKLIREYGTGTELLYDLEADPDERDNLLADGHADLRDSLAEFLPESHGADSRGGDSNIEINGTTRRQLEDLGYV